MKGITFVNQGILMHKIVKAAVVAGACVVLTGCPEVKSVQGSVYVPTFSIYGSNKLPAKVGDRPSVGAAIDVSPGASITISVAGTDGKDCELTYTSDFIVTEPVDCRKQKEENEQKQSQEQEQAQAQAQDQAQAGQQASQGGLTPSDMIKIANEKARSTYIEPYDASALNGPQVVATSVPTYTKIMQVVTNPVVTNTLAAIGALAVAKEVHDKTDGNNGDEPVSH